MSFEASFNLINDELSYLKRLFGKEIDILKRQSEEYLAESERLRSEHELLRQNYERELNESRRQIEGYFAELRGLRAEYELERKNWDDSRDIFQHNIVDLENELMKISESLPREKEFLECLPHIAFICNVNGEISYANQAFYSFFDAESSSPGWFPFGRAALDSAKERGSWAREISLKSKNGDAITVDAKLFSWNGYTGDVGGFIGVTADRTRLIEADEEKQRLQQELNSVNTLLSAEISSGRNQDRQKELRCMILGRFGSGKSALVNSLMGEKLLPEGEVVNVSVRCGRGAEKMLAAHYWNGERQSFYRENVTAERVETLLADNDLLWLELRSPDAFIPYGIMIEEVGEISEEVISKADAFIYLSPLRNYPPVSALDKIQSFLSDGIYGIFTISKTDLECDDYESEKKALSVASKIEGSMSQLRRVLYNYPKLRSCQILPVSSRLGMNIDSIVWHLEEIVSSYRTFPLHSPDVPPFKLPEKDESPRDYSNVLAPMLKAFHEQEFQAEFLRFIKSASGKSEPEKVSCLFISPHRESVNKLIARLAHDVSYARALGGTENNWAANFDDVRYTRISVPDSVLSEINFIITPETFDTYDEVKWSAMFDEYTPVVVLELTGPDCGREEFENIACGTCKSALRKKGFCIVSGEGLMTDKAEAVSENVNEWAGRDVPLFIYENYDVIMRSVTHE